MATIRQLVAATPKVIPTKHPTAMTGIHTAAALPINNSFVLEARFRPITELDAPFHQTSVVFTGLAFELEKSDKCPVQVALDPKKIVYMERPSMSKHQVRVRCSCKSFYFYWWWAVNKSASLAGHSLPPYHRLTPPPPEGRKYLNPRNVAGVCKHLLDTFVWMSANSFIAK